MSIIKTVGNGAKRAVFNCKNGISKHSPEILTLTGIAGGIGAAVMACKATTQLEDILEDIREDVKIHKEAPEKYADKGYTEADAKKDLVIVYSRSAIKIAKLYAPSVILGGLSVAAILTGNRILRRRALALASAYTGVNETFKKYRKSVVNKFGEETDKQLYFNLDEPEEVEIETVNEDGSTDTRKEVAYFVDPASVGPNVKFFMQGCRGWTKDPETNRKTLLSQQAVANEIIKQRAATNGGRGVLFLNDVYEMLGIDRTRAGQIEGWVYDEKHPVGDNFISFGIENFERNAYFINGTEPVAMLDFNTDGDVLQYI